MKRIIILVAAILAATNADAELRLKSFFSDGMVLQQQTEACLWGTADPGATVSAKASWNRKAVRTTTDSEGVWKLTIPTCKASYEHHSICVKSGKEAITIGNVLVGEVWFASGQSNMEMPIRGFSNCPVEGMADVISQAPADDRIRMFTVKREQAYEPKTDVEGRWDGANPNTVAEMSATAYFFARKLNSVIDIPVGIILSAYGGSHVESWTPREILETYPDVNLDREAIYRTHHWDRPCLMYNAMLAPLAGYTIKGFIWYQGCSNVGRHDVFVDRMSRMVDHWRTIWGDADCRLPFYQVEIAPCTTYTDEGDFSSAALLRAAQHEAARKVIPNGDIIVTNDLCRDYEAWNIHPCQKQPVGERLANMALAKNYGFSGIPCSYPVALGADIRKGKVCVQFSSMNWYGINRTHGIEGLEVKDENGTWHSVTKVDYNADKDLLWIGTDGMTKPVEVRYGWGAYRPGNLKAGSGLPVTPFDIEIR